MAPAALLAAVVVLSIAGQAQHAPGQVTVLSPESYPLAGGTQQILDLAASALLPGYAFAQSVALDLTPTGSITDTDALELKGPRGIATFTSGGSTYAAVAAGTDSGVQILNITDPRNIAAAGSTADRDDAELGGAWGIATFTSDGRTYAAVAAFNGNAVQILDVTEPSNVFPAGSIAGGALKLNSPRGIAIFNSTGGTYAAVAASGSNGVQILNVTDPYSVTAAGSIAGGALKLIGARGIATFTSGGDTYAAVAASGSKGVQILNVTDPTSITAAGSIAGDDSPALDGARAIAIFESGSGTYAAVAATFDDGIQILNVTDPYSVTAAGSITDTGDLELKRPWGIATFTSGNSTYAAVAAYEDNAVQILDVTDPSSITAAGSVTNTGDLELDGPQAIAIFESGGGTYAAVAAYDDDGVQIIHLAGNNAPTVVAGPDQTVSEGEPVSLPWSASDEDDDTLTYAWSQSPADPAITLVSPDSSPTTFTAPPVDSRTVIRLTLTASDGTASSSDTLRVIITDPSDIPLTAAGSIIDTDDLRLKGALGVAVFASGGSTYAAVTAFNEGVQILNVTDPYNIAAAGSIANTDTLELDGAVGIAIFESGGGTYAAVTASGSKGVQILNVTDPYNIAAAGSIANTDTLELDGADGIAVFESDGGTYAAVVAHNDDGVQILNVTDPSNVVAAGSINSTGAPELDGPRDIAIFASGGRTYAAVASSDSNGVQILNVTDPSNVAAAGSINSTGAPKLDGSQNIAVFVSGSSTYAAVAAYRDNAVQILNITDPSDITAAGSITDADAPRLQVPRGIAVFVSGSSTYAAVAAHNGNAVQVLNVTDPSSITAAGRIGDNKDRVLGGAWGIATFTSGGGTYAAVTADTDDGVQIIRLTGDTPNSPPVLAIRDPPPTFVSSTLYDASGVLAMTFSEDIDAANVVPAKIHVRESGTYAGGITLTAEELDTAAADSTISFALTPSHLAAVAELAVPELTIEPGAVRGTTGSLITGSFDASTAAFVGATSVSFQDANPIGMAFSSDGAKMFVIGASGDAVNEYALSAPFDASTLEFVNATYIGNREAIPTGMAFSSDGTRMFVIGASEDAVIEYALSAPFDASTLEFVDATPVSDQEATPQGMAFSSDGTKMFVIGRDGDAVNEYALSAPFDASTLNFTDATYIGNKESVPTGMAFSSDGTKMFVIGAFGDAVIEYALSAPFDASTRAFVDATPVSDQEATPQGMAFSSDGSKMFVIGRSGDNVNEYALSSVYPITVTSNPPPPPTFVSSTLDGTSGVLTITFSEDIDVTPAANVVPAKIHVRESGNYTGGITLTAAELETAADGDMILFDLTPSHLEAVAALAVPELTIEPGAVRGTARSLITGSFDASTAVFVGATSISSQEDVPRGMAFSSDGARMFVIGSAEDAVNEYELSAPFDASTLNFTDATPISSQELSPSGMAFSSDGGKMFVIGSTEDAVNEYELSAPFDASTLEFVDATPISSQETDPSGMAFSSDGGKMFVIGSIGDAVNEYALSAPFDASTLEFVDATSISSQEDVPRGMAFSSDGGKMFVIGASEDAVIEYALSTPFDASTLEFVDATPISSQETDPTGMAFSSDGAKMFVIGNAGDDVNEYALSSVYPITVTSNTSPTVDAGPDLPVTRGLHLALSGAGAEDVDLGDTLSYSWSQDPAGTVTFDDAASLNPVVVAPLGGTAASVALTLSVSDGVNDAVTDTMVLAIRDPPPTFVSSTLNGTSGALAITFSEAIDAANVVPAKIHVRESGNYTGGITLAAAELETAADGDIISFALTTSHLEAVAELAVPELTIEPGAARGTTGSLITGSFDASTAAFVDATSIRLQEDSPRGMAFSSDGARMFVIGAPGGDINEYMLSTPFDASTLEFVNATSISSQEATPRGMAFSSDGARMFVIGSFGGDIDEYALSTPFDASTLTFVDDTPIRLQEDSPRGMAFSSDGARMFVIGTSEDAVIEYVLSAPFDASTLTFVDDASISSQETYPTGMAFSSDGAKMFVIGSDGGAVNEYALSAPFDASALNFTDATYIGNKESDPTGMAFSSDGARMFVIGTSGDAVNEYALSSVYPITVTSAVTNTPPTVDAGPDQTVREGAAVSMPWTASDPDGDDITYSWSQDPDQPAISLGSPNSSPTTFTAPQVDSEAVITLTLTVNDGTASASDALQVTITDSPDGAFVTTWDPTFLPYTISIPLEVHSGGTLSIDWGDGSTDTVSSGTQSHTYAAPGEYRVSMAGDLARINLGAAGSTADKLASIDSWGDAGWSSMKDAFRGAFRMAYNATDAPDLSGVTDMSGMFHRATQLNGDLSGWNVSSVTDMSDMFQSAASFNQPLAAWNVSSVTDMSDMFQDAAAFDQPLAAWNVSSVTDMSGMFWRATSFNQPLADWNVSSVTDMSDMFYSAESFDQPLADWNVSSVTDMSDMFSFAASFTQPLAAWSVSSVTDMSGMFQSAASFDQPLADWNVSSVTDMSDMFWRADSFTQPLADWNVSSVTDMSDMFKEAAAFDQPLAAWNVSSVTDMSGMFQSAASFNQPLAAWNVSSVTDMSDMFQSAASFDQPLADWDVSSVTDMSSMFQGADSFNQPLAAWDVSSATDMSDMFLTVAFSFDQNLGRWYVVPADTAFDAADASLNVTTISAQNSFLDGHSPEYGIGSGHDSDLFSMTGSTLMFKGAPDPGDYMVSVTASGDGVFESGNNLRVLDVTVTGSANSQPVVDAGADLTLIENSTFTLAGSATDPDGDALTYAWTQSPPSPAIDFADTASPSTTFTAPQVDSDTVITLTLAASDGMDTATDSLELTVAEADGSFITTWTTTGADQIITIPVGGHGGTYTAVWGDGGTSAAVTGDTNHRYAEAGTYTVSVSGDFARFHLDDDSDNAPRLASIEQWGDAQWTSMEGAFWGASKMAYNAADAPDLSGVTGMKDMFRDASSFNGDLSSWNVSRVTDMGNMFLGATAFNQDLSSWNVSRVTGMDNMFNGAAAFNQDISPWDVSSVTDMRNMFFATTRFNQDLSSWNVSSVTDMDSMFGNAYAFNQDISSWDVSSVAGMRGMFLEAAAFNQDISSWNVSSVTSMHSMFNGAAAFNQDISPWDVSSVADMRGMFTLAVSFDQNLGRWYVVPADASFDAADTSLNVTTISAQNAFLDGHNPVYGTGSGHDSDLFSMTGSTLAFKGAPDPGDYMVSVTASGPAVFESGNNLRVLNVTVTGSANSPPEGSFITTWQTTTANEPITIPVGDATGNYTVDWGDGSSTTHITDAEHTYAAAGEYTVSISGDFTEIKLYPDDTNAEKLKSIKQWGSISWTTMEEAFWSASNMAYDATDTPDLSGVDTTAGMFFNAFSFNGDISSWDVSSVTDMSNMFQGATSFNQPLAAWNVSSVTDMNSMFSNADVFNQPLNTWNVSSVTDMSDMFLSISGSSPFNGDISSWDVSSVTDMSNMFRGASSFNQPLNTWNVSSVERMSGMFNTATSFDQPLNTWNVSSVERMSGMFNTATSFDQPLNTWNVSSVTYMAGMFSSAASFNQTLADWNVSSVTDMSDMFRFAAYFNQPLADWNVSSVTDMSSMFQDAAAFNQPLADWNVSSVTDMSSMFQRADSFNQPLADWSVSRVTDMSDMFFGASAFNRDISSWNVSGVEDMGSMFGAPSSFDQNLGRWYVVPADMAFDAADTSLNVTTISAQNSFLDGHSPDYGIGSGHNSTLFSMTGSTLAFKGAPDPGDYMVSVTASGDGVFSNGNNRRVLDVTVTDSANSPTGAGLNLTAADSIADTTTLALSGAWGIATFESGGSTYAAVTASAARDVQVLNVTDPYSVTAAGSIADTGGRELNGPRGIAIFESGGSTYAAVAGYGDAGVQILNVTDPYSVTAAGSITNTDDLELDGATGIATFTSGDSTYAAVAAYFDDGVQILNVTDPYSVTAAGSINNTGTPVLNGATGIAIFESGGATYAAVAAYQNDGVQILNVTDPYSVTAAGSITDVGAPELDGATDIAIFESGGSTYAAVTAYDDDVVQILNVTDPHRVTAAGSINSTDALALDRPWGIAIFESGGSTYAAVTAYDDDVVQILNVTDPSNVTATGSISNTGALKLDGPRGIATFESGNSTYAAVAASDDSGVQIIRLTGDVPPDGGTSPDRAFVTTWNPILSPHTISIPLEVHSGGTLSIDWGDGSTDTVTSNGTPSHTYAAPGKYQVSMTGDLARINLGAAGSVANRLASIDSWGDIGWSSMKDAFRRASSMAYNATDAPDLSSVTDMSGMFWSTDVFNGNLSSWNVSSVTDMSNMFRGATSFDQPLAGWNVSSVTDMSGMFQDATSFSRPLADWNVSSVTDMSGMFQNTIVFDQPLADWNVSSVTDMSDMFNAAISFKQPLADWNVSSVTDMSGMFSFTASFNQPLADWDVSSVTDMSGMFSSAHSFNQHLADWNVSSVIRMDSTFSDASAFDGDISGWNVSSVKRMNSMFDGASSFNGDISGWDVSGVEAMAGMFSDADAFDQNLGRWYVVPADASFDAADTSLNVTTISAQNAFLDGHNPAYGIGSGHNSTLFNMTGSTLAFKGVPSSGDYAVNVTAPGGNFGTNNHRILDIMVTGTDVNTDPVLQDIGSKGVNELATLSFTATATDGDNDTLTFSLAGTVPTGASITPAGAFSWTPTEQQDGTHTITVQVADDSNATDSETVTVTVNEVNVEPVLASVGNKSVDELVTLTFTATATDGDVIGGTDDALTFSLASGAPTGASITSAGAFSWTPTEQQDGTHTITIQVEDGSGATDSDTITVTVGEVNQSPVLNPIGSKSVDELVALTFTATATDGDVIGGADDALTFSLASGAPTGASITPAGAFSWTPTEQQDGTHTITVQVADDSNATDSETVTVTVNEVNVEPVLASVGNKSVDELVTLTFTATATDGDVIGGADDALTFSLASGAPTGASITSAGAFSWTPTEQQDGTHTITIQVEDGSGATDSDTITVTVGEVNQSPVLNPIGSKSVDELVALTFTATATDGDVIGGADDALTFSLASGAPTGASITPAGAFSWTPTEQQDGTHTITIQVEDGSGATDSDTITVTVGEVNQSPVLNPIGSKSVDELVALTFTATATDGDVIGGTDDALTFSLASGAPTGASITPAGAFSWTPTAGQVGTHAVTVVVTDGSGATDSEAVTVTVGGSNQNPVLGSIGDKSVNELESLTFTVTASDANNDTLEFSLAGTMPTGASITSAGAFSWTPTESQDGTHDITVQVSDGNGGSDSETFTVTVAEVNQSPMLNPIGSKSVDELVALTFTATATDGDVIGGTDDALTFSLASGAPTGASITPAGAFSWTPTAGQVGTHAVTVVVTDGSGATDSEAVTVTVGGSNQNPVLGSIGDKSVNELESLTFTVTASDANNDTLEFSLAGTMPTGASITSAGAFSWTPTESQDGTHDITVQVSDGNGGSDSETFTVTVAEVNQSPMLNPIGSKSVDELVALTFTATATDGDVIGGTDDALTFSLASGAPTGASITPAGAFSWTPTAGQVGTHAVTVVVTDGSGATDSEAVTVTVGGSNQNPVLGSIGDKSVNELESLTFTVTASDANNDTLEFSLAGTMPTGASITSAGAFSWTPTESQDGTHDITIQVEDGSGATDSETVTVTVNEVNQSPMLNPIGSKSVDELVALTFTATATDGDVIGGTDDALTFSLASGAPTGASITPAGAFSWTPTSGQIGTHTITIRVEDGSGATDSEAVTVRITADSVDPPTTRSGGGGGGGSKQTHALALDLGTVRSTGLASTPQEIVRYLSTFDPDEPIQPAEDAGRSDPPLAINGSAYLLGGTHNTLEPQALRSGEPTGITFTVYSTADIVHFAVNMSQREADAGPPASYTYIRFDRGTVSVADPDGLIADADVAITRVSGAAYKYRVQADVEFADGTGLTDMAITSENARGASTAVHVASAFEVLPPEAARAAPDVPAPEPDAPSDQEPPASPTAALRMWAGFGPATIGDAGLLAALGLDYPDAVIPAWVRTGLAPLVINNGIAVDEFTAALRYVLENTGPRGATNDAAGSRPADPDVTAPTVASIERSGPAGGATSAQTLVFAVTFSEDVTGVDAGDFALSLGSTGAGSIANLTGSGSQYLVTVSATRDGTYNLDVVRDSGIMDAAGNQLADAAPTGADRTYTVIADTTAPTVASIERGDPAEESTSETTLVFGVTFGEDVTGVDAGDFALSPDSGSGPGQFTHTRTPGLAIPDNAAAVSDTITVPGFGTATSVSVSVDITHPFIGDLMVELVAPDGTAKTLHRYSGEGADDIIRTYTPDFGGTGIAGDWTLRASDGAPGDAGTLDGWTLTIGHDGAGGSVTGLAGSGSRYLVTVSAPQGGTYNLDVVQDSGIMDAAGNLLADAAPTGPDHTYTVIADTTAPTVASIERGDPAEESTSETTLVFGVTFGEDVTGVDADDFALSPDSGGGPGQFTQTSTPALAIPDNAAAVSDTITIPDSGTATAVSVSVDITHPFIGDLMVELVAPDGTAKTLHRYSGEGADDIIRTYTPDFGGTGIAGDWTLRVSDRASGDAGTLNGWTLTVGHDGAGGSVTGLAGSGSQYLVTVSAPQGGTYNLYVMRDSGITDVAGNLLADAAPTGADHTYTVVADTTAPTVTSIERSDPAEESTPETTLVFGVTFGEDVTGVDAGDFALSPDSGSGPGQFTHTRTPGLAIPDNAAAVSDMITVPGPGTATSVSVAVDIAHPFIGDLMVELVAPDGTAKTLHRYSGEGADDIIRTYAPDFGGTGIAGDWTLRVSDRASGDAGTLNGWTLTVGHDGAGGSVTGLAGSGSRYLVTVSAPQGGTYNLDVVRDSGIMDAAGNQLADAAPTGADHTYTVVADTTAPTVTSIERSDPAGESTPETTLVFGVTFSEDVTGVDADDFALSPDSGGGPGQFTHTRMPGLAIPDNAAAVSDMITVPGPGIATSVSVSVDIAHPFIGDLMVELVAPDGTAKTLHRYSGEGADDIIRTYTPDFGGTGIAGDWTLRVSDRASGDAGTLNGWTLTVGHDGAGGSVTGLAGSGSQYLVTVSAPQGGTYNLYVMRDSGITDVAGNPLAGAAPYRGGLV